MPLTLEERVSALNYLMPDCSRVIDNGEIVWLDERPMPTDIELEVVIDTQKLNLAKKLKLEFIDAQREAAFDSGMPWNFNGTYLDAIQTRERDRMNLIAVTVASILSIMNNTPTEPVVLFRSTANVDYSLLPTEAIEMGVSALGFISQVYQYSWSLKDQTNAATTVAAVDAIVWNWIPPWEE